ncbi:hypothetical protein Dsin_005999 [Dipteronia sinensis]|uniref:RING-type domain-containing protein n=1 Tax=Dipteronia sinensis TaxID=43782 RepID=A0AAE0AYU7_9ROSI|nr:hypothetical protein Dsin_005999 [Dipteronia sinensis]
MAEPDQNSASTASSSSVLRESSAAATSSSSSQHVREQEESTRGNYQNDRVRVDDHIRLYNAQPEILEQEQQQQHGGGGFFFRGNLFTFEDVSAVRDDTWSCIIVVLTFWFFVSMTLILGVYGSTNIRLGPNASILIEPNPLFVQTVKVEELNDIKVGPKLYEFYKAPPLDVVATWSESYNVSVSTDTHQEWLHFLNAGSQINISYSVKSPSSSLFLIIAQGTEGLSQWLENPTYPNTTLSWTVIHGSGTIHQSISTSSSYYVAVGNLNSEEVEVQLDLTLRALQYNTSESYYKCTFTQGLCSLSLLFPRGNAIVLTSPSTEQGAASDGWYVRLSYGPRWLTYCLGIGGMTLLMLVAFHFLNKFRCISEDSTEVSNGDMESARAPLLPYKDDDLSSWGSSYDSASNDEEDIQEFLATYSLEGKSTTKEVDQEGNNTRRLCAICFDAPRDCFFLPCGHCVACFECGTRIAEAAGTCPICRRTMKKVRKIFTV